MPGAPLRSDRRKIIRVLVCVVATREKREREREGGRRTEEEQEEDMEGGEWETSTSLYRHRIATTCHCVLATTRPIPVARRSGPVCGGEMVGRCWCERWRGEVMDDWRRRNVGSGQCVCGGGDGDGDQHDNDADDSDGQHSHGGITNDQQYPTITLVLGHTSINYRSAISLWGPRGTGPP